MKYTDYTRRFVELSAMIDGKKKKLLKEFGNNLKTIRLKKGLSLRQLAATAELEHPQIVKMEAGRANPTLTTVLFLAEALAIDPRDLLP